MSHAHTHGHGHGRYQGHEPATAEQGALTRGITTLSVAVAATLIVVKGVAWAMSGSVALLASLADSGLDLAASLFTFFAVRYAAQPADAEHRFGHGKAEAFASLVQAGLVFASAALVAREALVRLADPQPVREEGVVLAVMAVSIALTAMLVWAQTRALKRVASVAVKGDRAHYFADLGGNAVVVAGVLGAWLLGWSALDAIAGLLVAAWLVYGAFDVFRASADQLMDHELSADERAELIALATSDPRVRGVHEVRTRASGPIVHIQMHMDLDPELKLKDAHEIVDAAELRIQRAWPHADVLIHPDPDGLAEVHAWLGEPSR
jgi:cation diffusion facilitator family transporter